MRLQGHAPRADQDNGEILHSWTYSAPSGLLHEYRHDCGICRRVIDVQHAAVMAIRNLRMFCCSKEASTSPEIPIRLVLAQRAQARIDLFDRAKSQLLRPASWELYGKHHEKHPHFPLTSHWRPARHNTAKMGFMDYLSDLYDSLTVQSVEAEEPRKDDSGE